MKQIAFALTLLLNTSLYAQDLTIHRVTVLPVTDNVNGLYLRDAEGQLKELLNKGHRFEYSEVKGADAARTLIDYEDKSQLVKGVTQSSNADAAIGLSIFKDDSGISLKMDLFLKSDGLLLEQEESKLVHRFTTTEVVQSATEMYIKLIKKIPYDGLILSREGNRVTVDIGSLDGVAPNTIITVDKIISLNRHPKFHFALGAERVILGKVKLIKVDETLSFGLILDEKERGMIAPDDKISGLDFVNYLAKDSSSPGSGDSVSFKVKSEVLPQERPSFGKVGVGLGVGSMRSALSFQTLGSFEGESSFYPQLQLEGEIWITKNWFSGTRICQGTVSQVQSTAGGVSGAITTTDYDLYAGYKFLLQGGDFWGPQINLRVGFGSDSMIVGSASATSLSSTRYSGLYYGLGGAIPITSKRNIYLDLELDRFFLPQFSESPDSSGATSSSSAMQISFGGKYEFSPHIWFGAHLQYEFYSTTFSGEGARQDVGLNSSQSLTALFTSVDYTF